MTLSVRLRNFKRYDNPKYKIGKVVEGKGYA